MNDARAEMCFAAGLLVASVVVCLPVILSGGDWGFWDWDIFLSNLEAARISVVSFGQAPGWNPYLRGGEGLAAHPMLPLASPAFLGVLGFGTLPGVKIWIVARQFIALFGAYWLGRRLGFGRWGAITVSVVFGLASTYGQRVGHGHWNLQAFVYLPLLVAAGLDAVRSGGWRSRALAGATLSLMFLDGGPYTFALGVLGVGAALAVGIGRGAWRSALAGTAVVGVLALSLSAVKLFPVFETWSGFEARGGGRLLDFYDPDFVPSSGEFLHAALLNREQSNRPGRFATFHINVGAYVGVLGLLLVAVGLVGSRVARLALLLGLPVLWLSLGSSPSLSLWEFLHRLPVGRSMTVPAKFTPGYLLALAVAAGAGVEVLRRWLASRPRLRWVPAVLVFGLVVDLVLVSRPLFGHAFPIAPIPLKPGPFHQVRHSPFEAAYFERVKLRVGVRPFSNVPRHSLTANLPAVRSNLGVLDTDAGTRTLTPVRARPDPGAQLAVVHRSLVPGAAPRLLRWSPNELRIEVDPRRGGRLVVNQNHHRGWIASGAGRALRVVPHSSGLLAVELEPGVSEVELRFRSIPARWGAGVSLVAAGAAAAMGTRRS